MLRSLPGPWHPYEPTTRRKSVLAQPRVRFTRFHRLRSRARAVTGCVLGFDYGTRWIGVASGNRISGSAHALPALAASAGKPDWARVDALLADWQPEALVVGLPLTRDGGEQRTSRAARAFADALAAHSGLPVDLVDERHTSQEAARRFAALRAAGTARRRDAANIDSLAACVILESWLQR